MNSLTLLAFSKLPRNWAEAFKSFYHFPDFGSLTLVSTLRGSGYDSVRQSLMYSAQCPYTILQIGIASLVLHSYHCLRRLATLVIVQAGILRTVCLINFGLVLSVDIHYFRPLKTTLKTPRKTAPTRGPLQEVSTA